LYFPRHKATNLPFDTYGRGNAYTKQDFYFEEDMLDEGVEQRMRVEAEHKAEQVVNRLSDEQLEALEREVPDRSQMSHKSALRGKGKAIDGVEDEDEWQAGARDAALR
jgi:hypothetical protein